MADIVDTQHATMVGAEGKNRVKKAIDCYKTYFWWELKHQKKLKILKLFGIVMTAAIIIHEFYFDIYADSVNYANAVNYVVELSCISNIYIYIYIYIYQS